MTAIQRAAEDGNDATLPDSTWRARGGNSGSPEYWSGHSSFSSAAATVLADFCGTDLITFTLTTDSAHGQTRTFSSFSEAAQQAGYSRVLGGLHFSFSNTAGLVAGRQIAIEVLHTALLPTTHQN